MLQYMLGNVRHMLDDGYRMRIPAKFTKSLGDPAYIVPGRKVMGDKRCLYILPHERFESVVEKLDTQSLYGGDETIEDATVLLGLGDTINEDPQGRVKLEKSLCSFAGIFKEIVFVGKGTYLEVWAAEVWDERFGVLNSDNLNKVLENLKKHGV